VAYSRVHTGVHYPGDVVVGSILGASTAAMVGARRPHGRDG
jgi:undecaprenyl-diphosphatase